MPESPHRHVCCCIDRGGGEATLAEARRLAGDGGRVTILHVAEPEPVVAAGLTEWGEVDRDDPLAPARAWLDGVVSDAGGGDPVLLSGDPAAAEACRWARRNHVDLMVTRARAGSLRQMVLGSFAGHLAAEAPCPVLLLAARGDDASPDAGPVGPFSHVAAVTDGSPATMAALDSADDMATRGRSRVTVVMLHGRWRRMIARAIGSGVDPAPGIERRSRELSGTSPVTLAGRPAAELDRWARDAGVDLIVVTVAAPRGPRLRRDAGTLAAAGTCSVLIERPRPTTAQPGPASRAGEAG